MGSTWLASRAACSPVPWVISSGCPCAVLQTACTMFPRSKRGSWKVSYAVRTVAKNATDHTTIVPHTSSGHRRARHQASVRDCRPAPGRSDAAVGSEVTRGPSRRGDAVPLVCHRRARGIARFIVTHSEMMVTRSEEEETDGLVPN